MNVRILLVGVIFFLIGDEWERNRLEWKFCGISFPVGIFPHAMDTSKT